MAARRLTRKEIVQEDPIRRALTETSSWAVRNINFLLAILGIIVLIAIASFVWQLYSESRNEQVQAEFGLALETFHTQAKEEAEALEQETAPEESPEAKEETSAAEPDQEEAAPAPQQPEVEYRFNTAEERYREALAQFKDIATNRSGQIAALSKYYVALCLSELDRTDEAKAELGEVIAESSWPEVSNLARNVLAQFVLEDGNYAEAITHLSAILEDSTPNFPKQVILLRLAQATEATGDFDKALEYYRQIDAEYSGSQASAEAQNQIRRLELQLGIDKTEEEPAEDAVDEAEASEPSN